MMITDIPASIANISARVDRIQDMATRNAFQAGLAQGRAEGAPVVAALRTVARLSLRGADRATVDVVRMAQRVLREMERQDE